MSEEKQPSISRRRVLRDTAAGAAGLGVGLAAGIVLGEQAAPRAVPQFTARKRFQNKVVLITGATSGIGRAAAIRFAAEGGKVAFCGRRQALGHEVEQVIKTQGGEALYIPADVRSESSVAQFVEQVVARYGRLDVAFNNAGVTLEKPLHEYAAAEWDDVLNTNLRGVFFSMKYQIPHMLAGGGGNIVVTSSSNAISTTAKRGAYAASKRAIVALVQSAALDYVGQNIRINTLIPGTTDTALVRRVAGMEDAPEAIWQVGASRWAHAHVPMGRMASADEIAAFALTLASDEHPFMTGAQLVIDGGKTAQGG